MFWTEVRCTMAGRKECSARELWPVVGAYLAELESWRATHKWPEGISRWARRERGLSAIAIWFASVNWPTAVKGDRCDTGRMVKKDRFLVAEAIMTASPT